MMLNVTSVLCGTLANLRTNIGLQICRSKTMKNTGTKTRRVKSWTGLTKVGGIPYFPRPGEVDPPYEPTKLFMVHRIKPVKGNPYWQKRVLEDLRIDGKKNAIAIVKNEPFMNARLFSVKHLIKITPIKLPEKLPDENDLRGGYLKENGEFIVSEKLGADSKRIEETIKFIFSPDKLDGETLRKKLRLKWLNSED